MKLRIALSLCLLFQGCDSFGAADSVQAKALDLPTFQDCETCPLMTTLPPGSFEFGPIPGDKDAQPREGEQTLVEIPQAFAISVYEVTNQEYAECVSAGACNAPKGRAKKAYNSIPNIPISGISWEEAMGYAAWLSEKTGHSYRLPTEIEWEYAARGGTDTLYWWGNTMIPNKENCFGCQPDPKRPKMFPFSGVEPVGGYQPNPFGLYDMIGNVSEWTLNCRGDRQLKLAQAAGELDSIRNSACDRRVLRGSNNIIRAAAARISYFGFGKPDHPFDYMIGIRLIRDDIA
ncbi:MAG: SUMF1/EgtB/PvdO family nonheme iron enzyme [Pseudomonadota bacterium]